jgi:hypothetical protein
VDFATSQTVVYSFSRATGPETDRALGAETRHHSFIIHNLQLFFLSSTWDSFPFLVIHTSLKKIIPPNSQYNIFSQSSVIVPCLTTSDIPHRNNSPEKTEIIEKMASIDVKTTSTQLPPASFEKTEAEEKCINTVSREIPSSIRSSSG